MISTSIPLDFKGEIELDGSNSGPFQAFSRPFHRGPRLSRAREGSLGTQCTVEFFSGSGSDRRAGGKDTCATLEPACCRVAVLFGAGPQGLKSMISPRDASKLIDIP